MDSKVAVLLALAACLAVLVEAHNHNRHPGRPSRHVKRHLEEFLEPPPPPPGMGGAAPPASVVRSRRGNMPPGAHPGGPPGAAPAPPPGSSPSLSLGERIARWFYAGPNDGPGGPGKTHGNKGAPPPQPPTMVGLSPPPPPPGPAVQDALPHTAEAVALMEQKPPPPQQHQPAHPAASQDQHASGTEHHGQGYQGGYLGNQGGYQQQQQQQNYPVLMPQSYLRTTDCNPCNNVPWIPMARAHATGNSNTAQQDSYGPPAAGEAWGQASDAVPLAHAPIAFPALHKGPLPPVFPAEDFTRVPPEPPAQPIGLRDHLVPPTPEHDSVVFTINEEQRPEPEQPAANELAGHDLGVHDLGGEGEVKAAPDQLHQGTLQHHHALQHHVGAHSQHHVPHLAHAQGLQGLQQGLPHHVPPPVNAVPDHVPYSAAKGGSGVELVQSVPIASYLASIEYPMTFIQSPLIEIPVKSVAVPHGFVASPQPLQQYQPVVAPTPLSAASHHVDVHQTHAGSLPLQGEHHDAQAAPQHAAQPNHAPRLADSAPSASIQHHNLPPCRHYAAALAAQAAAQSNANQYAHHHEDAATANSQTSHAYAQELAHFESQKVAPTSGPNNYRLLEDGATASSAASSAWPSTSAAPPTVAWDASAAATVTANGASGYSAPSAPSGPSGPNAANGPSGKGSKKTKQIQIIVPYTIDKESGQVRLHSELMQDELSGAGAEPEGVISYTPPPDLPPSAAGLPSGLEALVQQTARKVPHGVSAAGHNHHHHHQQPQAQESVVVAELSPTPWHAAAPQQDKAAGAADPFAGLQHILATDLRTLLRNEEDSVDRLRLQKNIDNWTAQEYSSLKATRDTEAQEANPGVVTFNFTSTTASVGTSAASSAPSSASSASSVHGKLNPSKKIPKEYLTTTPLTASPTPTTTPAPTARSTPRRKDSEPTKRPAKIHHVRKNATRDDRKTKNGWTLVDNLVVPGPSSAPSTATTPRSTPAPATPDNHRPSEQTRAPWERLQVSISPLTREKVYVVTPQTPAKGEATTPSPTTPTSAATAATAAGDANKHVNINDLSPFRKWMDVPSTTPAPAAPASSSTQHTRPRFSIRPTPGWPKPRPHGFRSTQASTATTSAASAPSSAATATPTAERLASTGSETTPTPVADKVTKASRATPRGFAVETISGHSKVFTATTSAWAKNKKAVDADAKKSTTAKPTTVSAGSRTTRALRPAEGAEAVEAVEAVTAAPGDALSNHRVDLSDIDAEASASVLHHHVAQLTPLGAAILKAAAVAATTTEHPTSFVTPSTAEDATETPSVSGPEIVIVEGRREATTTAAADEASTTDASTTAAFTASTAVTEATSSRTTRAIKTIGRRPDGSRYILTEEEAKQQNGLSAQRTKLQAVSTPKKYESPPPRPKPHKVAASEALFRRKPSRRPPHLVMTPDRGSYLWNFSEFSGTSHEDMVEDDMTAIKGAVVELKKEATEAASSSSSTTAAEAPSPSPSPAPASSTTPSTASSTTAPPPTSTSPAASSSSAEPAVAAA